MKVIQAHYLNKFIFTDREQTSHVAGKNGHDQVLGDFLLQMLDASLPERPLTRERLRMLEKIHAAFTSVDAPLYLDVSLEDAEYDFLVKHIDDCKINNQFVYASVISAIDSANLA